MNENIEQVPFVALEAQAAHYDRIIRRMIVGWSLTVAVFTTAIICIIH